MTNSQRAKLDSYNRITDFNTKYATEIAAIPEYATEKTAFDSAVAIINNVAGTQVRRAGVNNNAVVDAKQTMASVTIKFAIRAHVKAKQLDKLTLASQLDEPESYIIRAPKTIAVQRAQELRNLLNDNLTALTNITAANITEIDTAITKYDNIKDEPTQSMQTKKASGTDILPPNIKKADDATDNMFSLIKSYYGDTNPVMVNEMGLAVKIINTGVHHTEVEIKVLADETGNPVTGAKVLDNASGKQFDCDARGVADLGSHNAGEFDFTISAPGRNAVVFRVMVARGSQNTFTVRLTPAN